MLFRSDSRSFIDTVGTLNSPEIPESADSDDRTRPAPRLCAVIINNADANNTDPSGSRPTAPEGTPDTRNPGGRPTITISQEDMDRAMEAMRGNPLPEDAPLAQVQALQRLLADKHQRLTRLQTDLDERRQRADESSARRASLSAHRSTTSDREHTSRHRARVPNLSPHERRNLTRNLATSFLTTDEQGFVVPKTPQGALLAATTYLL